MWLKAVENCPYETEELISLFRSLYSSVWEVDHESETVCSLLRIGESSLLLASFSPSSALDNSVDTLCLSEFLSDKDRGGALASAIDLVLSERIRSAAERCCFNENGISSHIVSTSSSTAASDRCFSRCCELLHSFLIMSSRFSSATEIFSSCGVFRGNWEQCLWKVLCIGVGVFPTNEAGLQSMSTFDAFGSVAVTQSLSVVARIMCMNPLLFGDMISSLCLSFGESHPVFVLRRVCLVLMEKVRLSSSEMMRITVENFLFGWGGIVDSG